MLAAAALPANLRLALHDDSRPSPASLLSAMALLPLPSQALFVKPMLLVLDEPTNHLDLGACVWLEDYLAKWESILLLTSHSQEETPSACVSSYPN